jgi:hypothetical protein
VDYECLLFYCDWFGWFTNRSLLEWLLIYELRRSESESYITTDCQSASLSWNKAPFWVLRLNFYYCQTVVGLFMWGALSDERMDLSFTIPPGPRQRSYFRVRVPRDSWPYFTVSDSRLPFSSPPTTRRVTVEVFNLASTRESIFECLSLSLTLRSAVSQSVSLSWNKLPIWGLRSDFSIFGESTAAYIV